MKINVVGMDPGSEVWSKLYELLEKEIQLKTLTYSICAYERSVSDEQLSDCDGIIFLEMNPSVTNKPFIRLDEDETEKFGEKLQGLIKTLHLADPVLQQSIIEDKLGVVHKKMEKKRSTAATVFLILVLVLAIGVIGFNAYSMFKLTRPLKEAADPFPGQPRDTALCMGNLVEYQLFFMGKISSKPELLCPVSGETYKFSSAGSARIISCPTPERHDPPLKVLRVVGENAPEVIQ